MKRMALIILFALMFLLGDQSAGADEYEPVALCGALERVRPGEVLPVVVSGVYEVDTEAQVLFDPEQPVCDWSVQPATWVEFVKPVPADHGLAILLKESRRARVRFQGRLFGPGVLPPDEPSLPFAAAFAKRVRNRRYGHLNSFRTKFVVEAVLEVEPVPAEVPWEWGGRPTAFIPVPPPIRLEVPRYPAAAREQGITGKVVVRVTVAAGRVTATSVSFGDRTLVGATISNLETWNFDGLVNTSFTTTFSYLLERRKAGDEKPRIELRLPDLVTITAASYDW